jgi:hypothetical protein
LHVVVGPSRIFERRSEVIKILPSVRYDIDHRVVCLSIDLPRVYRLIILKLTAEPPTPRALGYL